MSDIHPDLEWIVKNTDKWGGTTIRTLVFVNKETGEADYCSAEYYNIDNVETFTHPQYLHARHVLGLDDHIMTEEEAELPAEEYKRTAESFLRQAAELMKERGKQYDQPGGERSMGKTVEAFNAITGRNLSESEGWLLMGLLKSVRQYSGDYHQDSAEDKVAYAALEAESLEASALRARELGE